MHNSTASVWSIEGIIDEQKTGFAKRQESLHVYVCAHPRIQLKRSAANQQVGATFSFVLCYISS